MAFFYSATTGGFYTEEAHGTAIPADAVEVTDARHSELMDAQEGGAAIVAGANGHPRAQLPPIAERRRQAVARVRAEARRRIRAISPEWRQLNDLRNPGAAADRRFALIDAVRAASDVIEKSLEHATAAELADLAIAARSEWPTGPQAEAR